MGVYNPWAEMPRSCIVCDFRYSCPLSSQNAHGLSSFKHPNCPLVEVKAPHGRLGDLDALKDEWKRGEGDDDYEKAWITTVRRSINAAPTVLEAEG